MDDVRLTILQIDAFSDKVFGGNPAAVCKLQEWLPDAVLQSIANENNLSETAYYVEKAMGVYDLRWFTPTVEVNLCGHATLATAAAIFEDPNLKVDILRFSTLSGELLVTRSKFGLSMDFPLTKPFPIPTPPGLFAALGIEAGEVFEADDYVVVVSDESIIEGLAPNLTALNAFPKRGIAVTARAKNFDFVSRWFGPRVGVNEDPVTGSAHTWLAPYWSEVLGKTIMTAQQGGTRKGTLVCEIIGERVNISGQASFYLRGEIEI